MPLADRPHVTNPPDTELVTHEYDRLPVPREFSLTEGSALGTHGCPGLPAVVGVGSWRVRGDGGDVGQSYWGSRFAPLPGVSSDFGNAFGQRQGNVADDVRGAAWRQLVYQVVDVLPDPRRGAGDGRPGESWP